MSHHSDSSPSMHDLTGLIIRGDKWLSFRLKSLLGSGGFSRVYLGEHIWTGELFAIKCLPIFSTDRDSLNYAETEAGLHSYLTSVGHPNVIDLVYSFIDGKYMFLVLQYADGGDLYNFLAANIHPESTLKHIFQQVVEAVTFCHSAGIAHRDIKPENFIVRDGRVCLTDFGLASVNRGGMTHNIGTTPYMSPECFGSGRHYDYHASDAWSVGVLLLTMLTGKLPWSRPSLDDPNFAAFRKHPYIWLGVQYPWLSKDALDILIRLLAFVPTPRMTVSALQDNLRSIDKLILERHNVVARTTNKLTCSSDTLYYAPSSRTFAITTANLPPGEEDALFYEDAYTQDKYFLISIDPVYPTVVDAQYTDQYLCHPVNEFSDCLLLNL